MRSYEEYLEILDLKKQGLNNSEISRKIDIPLGTVKNIINRFWACGVMASRKGLKIPHLRNVVSSNLTMPTNLEKYYAFLLGMYLGDGHINKEPRTYKMRISLHSEQNKVLRLTKDAMEKIFPCNKVNLRNLKNAKAKILYFYSNDLPRLFPQHGKGKKHDRKIELEEWQKEVLNRNSWSFLNGLIFSDGCRYESNGRIFYQFTNKSLDIMNIFLEYCKKCEIIIKMRVKNNGVYNTNIYRKKYIELMDLHIGSKYE